MTAWNGWYHIDGHTYGTWLRGDPRGWRARHHREHVEGDYRHPPPAGTYDHLYRLSKQLMKARPVFLNVTQRREAALAIVSMLQHIDIQVIAVSVDAMHYHILAKLPDANVHLPVGRAKKHAAFVLKDAGHQGKAWAVRCRPLPVKDRSHQVNVFNYILSHREEGAFVWTYRDASPPPPAIKC
jgi:hypothetical protein